MVANYLVTKNVMQLFVIIVRKYRLANAYIYQIKKINKEKGPFVNLNTKRTKFWQHMWLNINKCSLSKNVKEKVELNIPIHCQLATETRITQL